MRVFLKSNFDAAGIFEKGYIEMAGDLVTLRHLLDELSQRSKGTMELINQETQEVNPEISPLLSTASNFLFYLRD